MKIKSSEYLTKACQVATAITDQATVGLLYNTQFFPFYEFVEMQLNL